MIATVFFKAFELDAHEGAIRPISVPEVDFIEGLPFEAGCPVWLDLPILNFFESCGDSIKPFAVQS